MSPRLLLVLACLAAASAPAGAQQVSSSAPAAASRAHIGEAAGRDASGRLAINQSAGSGNAQANLAAIALTPDGLGLFGLQSRQAVLAGARERGASALIDGAALHGGHGLVSVNQAAGTGNAQANLIGIGQGAAGLGGLALAQGVAGLDDAALAAVAGAAPAADPAAPAPLREAVIAGEALRDSRGVVQINQTAGVGNGSANAIVLLLPGGSP